MSNDDEVIKEAEALLAGAMDSVYDEQRREHIHSLPVITEKFVDIIKNKRTDKQTVHLAYIQPDNYLDLTAEVIASTPVDIDDVVKEPDKYVSAKMFLFYSFDTIPAATKCFSESLSGILANELHSPDTAAYMYIRRKKYGIAVLIAANALTISRITDGDTITDHTPLSGKRVNDETPDKFFASCSLTKTEGNLIRSLIEFHYKPQEFKKQFPNAYQATLNKVKRELGFNPDGSKED